MGSRDARHLLNASRPSVMYVVQTVLVLQYACSGGHEAAAFMRD